MPCNRDCCQHCCQAAGQRLTGTGGCGISAQRTTNGGRAWTMCPLLRIRCSRAERNSVAVRAGRAAASRETISWATIHTAAPLPPSGRWHSLRCGSACRRMTRGLAVLQQVRRLICVRICARDSTGQTETDETQETRDDFAPQVCRGQRGDRRLPETERQTSYGS